MRFSLRPALCVVAAVILPLLAPSAAGEPYGDPFRVNVYTPGNQSGGSVSTGANGDTAVLYADAARGNGGFVRRYDAAGRPLTTEEWFVGFGALGVAVSGSGSYAIARSAPDGSGQGIFVTVYNRAGSVVVPEFRVNDATLGEQYFGGLAMNQNGQFVVSWSQRAASGGVGSDYFVKRFQANGAAVAPATLVRTTPGNSVGMAVAIDGPGNFVATWSELVSSTGNNWDVFARRYSSTALALGPAFRVNSFTTGLQVSSWIGMNATGSFVVAWTSYGQTGSSSWNVYAQRYNASGAMLGGEIQVSVESSYYQPTASVGVASNGSFVIGWHVDNRGVDPSMHPYVLARSYTAAGAPDGAPFAVSTASDKNNEGSSIGMDPDGNITIGWRQYDPVALESDAYARRFLPVGASTQVLPNPGQLSGLAGAAGSWQYFKFTVPPGHATVDFSIFGTVGDADLYVRQGALPTLNRWDGRPFLNGSNESARMTNWPAGDWYIGINGFSGYSGLDLLGNSF